MRKVNRLIGTIPHHIPFRLADKKSNCKTSKNNKNSDW
jgi:hypothetical protein